MDVDAEVARLTEKSDRMFRAVAYPLRAWFFALLAGSLLAGVMMEIHFALTASASPLSASYESLFVSIMACATLGLGVSPPAPLAIFIVRALRLPRPFSDGAFGGALALAVYVWMSQDPAIAVPELDVGRAAPLAFVPGAMTGVIYWLLAGRPRPPYRAAW